MMRKVLEMSEGGSRERGARARIVRETHPPMKRPAPDSPPAGNPAGRSRGVVIDEATGTAFADGKPLPLSPTEFLLLRTLVAREGRALSRGEILQAMHGGPGNVRDDSLNFTVHSLRKKLGRHWPSVRTVWGKGYAWQPATESGLRRRTRRRIALSTAFVLAVAAAAGLALRGPGGTPEPAPRPAPDRKPKTGDLSQITLGRGSLCASASDRGVPGREPERAIDGDPATCYESVSPAVFGWHWLRVDWATNKAGRVSVLLGRPEDGPPHLPAYVEVASDGRTWRRIGETDETTNAVVAEVSESFRSLRVRPGADGGRPLAVREISVEPAAAPF